MTKLDRYDQILNAIKANPGKTRKEIEACVTVPHSHASDVFRDLMITGHIVELKDKRINRAGRSMTVNVYYATYE